MPSDIPSGESSARDLQGFFRRPIIRNIVKVATGNLFGNAFNFVALYLLSNSLDPGPRGLFTVLQADMLLLASLTDFGINTTIIKYYNELTAKGRTGDAEALMRRVLWLRIGVVVSLAAVAYFFAETICYYLIHDANQAPLFRLMCLGGIGSSLWMYCQAAMQARKQFGWYSVLSVGNHVLRLALVVIVIALGKMDVPPAAIIVMAVPFAGALGSSLLWPRDFWRSRMDPAAMKKQIVEIFHFSKWIFLSTLIVSVLMRLEILLLERYSTLEQAGQFGNANDLAQGFAQITAALSTVLLPRLSGVQRRDDILRIMHYVVRALPVLLVGAIATSLLAHWLIPFIRHGKYTPSIPTFDLLIVGFSISMVVTPLSFFCLAFQRASWLTWMNLLQLFIGLGLGLFLIPAYGAFGAGISLLAVRLFALFFLALAFPRLLALSE